MERFRFTWCVAVLMLAGSAPAIAGVGEPMCVTCSGPDQVYRCSVDATASGAPQIAMQLFCVQELARAGQHKSCSVRRAAGVCDGEPRDLVYAAPDVGIAAPTTFPVEESDAPTVEAALPGTAVSPTPASPEPETLAELASQAAAGTGAQLTKAGQSLSDLTTGTGEAVGGAAASAGATLKNAAQTTWSCLTSLFSNCKAAAAATDETATMEATAAASEQ